MAEKLGLTQRAGWEGKLYREDRFRQLYNEKAGSFGEMTKTKP